jgi:hypothetical protein
VVPGQREGAGDCGLLADSEHTLKLRPAVITGPLGSRGGPGFFLAAGLACCLDYRADAQMMVVVDGLIG